MFRNHGETHYFAAGDKPRKDSFSRGVTQLNSSFIDCVRPSVAVRSSLARCRPPGLVRFLPESVRVGARLPR